MKFVSRLFIQKLLIFPAYHPRQKIFTTNKKGSEKASYSAKYQSSCLFFILHVLRWLPLPEIYDHLSQINFSSIFWYDSESLCEIHYDVFLDTNEKDKKWELSKVSKRLIPEKADEPNFPWASLWPIIYSSWSLFDLYIENIIASWCSNYCPCWLFQSLSSLPEHEKTEQSLNRSKRFQERDPKRIAAGL